MRRGLHAVAAVLALLVSGLAAHWIAGNGFPLADAHPVLAVGAGFLLLLSFGCKAYGWSRLFAPHERPSTIGLAVAGGAASLTSVALPGRFDDAVRVAVVRKHPGTQTGVATIALSLFALGLIDTVALMPLASTGAAVADSAVLRAGLAVVAFAGLGAAAVVLGLPRFGASARLVRFRVARWLHERWPSRAEAGTAFVFVLISWLARGVGLWLLLVALGIDVPFALALVFMCGAAASGALPVAPASAATQAGAGAAVLVASGVSVSQAITFAAAAQVVSVLVGGSVVVGAAVWHGGRRLAARVA